MKLRLFLFLFFACTLLTGSAMAQGCTVNPLKFPTSGGSNRGVASGTCIASVDASGTQTGRLRWDNADNGRLQLFDTDDGGQSLWCALNSGSCAIGQIFCLQADGNAVIYTGSDCNTNKGTPLWASNTDGDCGIIQINPCTDEDQEELFVQDNLSVNGVHIGEAAVIYNDTAIGSDEPRQLLWHSASSD